MALVYVPETCNQIFSKFFILIVLNKNPFHLKKTKRNDCQTFTAWKIKFKMIKMKSQEKHKLFLRNFTQNLQECPVKVSYEFQAADYCINPRKCFFPLSKPKSIFNIFERNYYFKLSTCPCLGHLRVACGKNYCAMSRASCQVFMAWLKSVDDSKKANFIHDRFGFQKCTNNDRMLLM